MIRDPGRPDNIGQRAIFTEKPAGNATFLPKLTHIMFPIAPATFYDGARRWQVQVICRTFAGHEAGTGDAWAGRRKS
jgi:hypothetical protein